LAFHSFPHQDFTALFSRSGQLSAARAMLDVNRMYRITNIQRPIRVAVKPKVIKLAEINRQTPKPSLRTKVDRIAAINTLVSLNADTMAIGESASAQIMIQYAPTCMAPPKSPVPK